MGNEAGFFSASSVKAPFSKITGNDAIAIPNFSRHLKEFCDPNRGPVLIREGKPKSYEYRFNDSLLRPYVIIKGVRDRMIDQSDLPN